VTRVVMDTLGHSQISLTMNTYSRVVPALQRDAADKLDEVFEPVATRVATRVAEQPIQ
jgi:integrase